MIAEPVPFILVPPIRFYNATYNADSHLRGQAECLTDSIIRRLVQLDAVIRLFCIGDLRYIIAGSIKRLNGVNQKSRLFISRHKLKSHSKFHAYNITPLTCSVSGNIHRCTAIGTRLLPAASYGVSAA